MFSNNPALDLIRAASSSASPSPSSPSPPSSPSSPIIYDEAALLAYDSWKDEKGADVGNFETFKTNYIACTIENVKAKSKVKVLNELAGVEPYPAGVKDAPEAEAENPLPPTSSSSPAQTTVPVIYDEAALLAYDSWKEGKTNVGNFETFKTNYLAYTIENLGAESLDELEEMIDKAMGINPDGSEMEEDDIVGDVEEETIEVPVPDFVGEQLEKVPDLVGSAYEELAKEPTPEEVAERKRNEEERRIARDKADKIRAEEMKAMQARKTAVREASEKARQEKLDKINKIREDEEKTRLAKAAADAKALKEAETKKAKVESDRRAAIDKEKSARQAQQSKLQAAALAEEEAAVIAASKMAAARERNLLEQVNRDRKKYQETLLAKANLAKEAQSKLRKSATPKPPDSPPPRKSLFGRAPTPKPPATKPVSVATAAPTKMATKKKVWKSAPVAAAAAAKKPLPSPAKKATAPPTPKKPFFDFSLKKAPLASVSPSKTATKKKVGKSAPVPAAAALAKKPPPSPAKKAVAPTPKKPLFDFSFKKTPASAFATKAATKTKVAKPAAPKKPLFDFRPKTPGTPPKSTTTKKTTKPPTQTPKKPLFDFSAKKAPTTTPKTKTKPPNPPPSTKKPLFNINFSANRKAPATPATALPKDNIPVLKNWSQNSKGEIIGNISNSKDYRNGQKITTSAVRNPKPGIVSTSSGSKYRLM
ncbi:hypothetical protein TrRE_jg12775 [Triparma retinervis]|uniref:Uncharacterized protein n=1 Tax=Triparma retinervis TaxID=2557542 RepID=A0A9W7AVL6_9STRA|nr:hypothetical protein TrRE_jg12775 [Triparma retinervis]